MQSGDQGWTEWVKSTASNPNGECLEWRCMRSANSGARLKTQQAGVVQVRDSRLGDASPVLSMSPAAWQRFLAPLR